MPSCPRVESGLVTLIGATTENPYFEVNAALLSRCAVVELEPLSDEEVGGRRRARRGRARSRGAGRTWSRRSCGGPAAMPAARSRRSSSPGRRPSAEGVPLEAASRRRRRPQAAAALRPRRRPALRHHLGLHQVDARRRPRRRRLLPRRDARRRARTPRFIARRMVILASEDVGNADPRALVVAVAAAQALEHVGLPEAQLNLAQAAIYLARAPKSNASAQAIWEARRDVRERGILPPPADARATRTTPAPATRGHGEGYVSPARRPGRRSQLDHLRTSLEGGRYYVPSGNGEEGGDGDSGRVSRHRSSTSRRRRRAARAPADFRGKRNVLLVFHPFAFTPVCSRGGARPAGEPRVVPERRDRGRLRLVRHLRRPPGLEAGARRHVHVRLGFLAARRRRAGLRRLQRGDRRTDARDVPDRQGRAS